MSKGIVLIACGHPYYGEWALNLCLSIKYNDMFLPVTLLHKDKGIDHISNHRKFFDKVIELTEEQTTRNGVQDYVKSKLYLYEISPYDETIFIDVDVIMLRGKSLTELFKQLKDVDFTIGCRNVDDLEKIHDLQWTTADQVTSVYGTGELYHISSEFIYFKKTPEVKEFFDTALKIHSNPEITFKRFNGSVPDELPLQLAMKVMGIKPHKVPFLPFYWEHFEKKLAHIGNIPSQYYGYSMGGCMNRDESVRIYNGLAHFYANQYHTPVFTTKHKRYFMPMRETV